MAIPIDISSEIVQPKEYVVSRCSENIKIDGLDDDTCWNTAAFSDKFIDIEGEKTPKYVTRIKMLWDSTYLYIFAQLKEPHIWGDIKERDAVIFYNNDFEVFLSPSGRTRNYGEIEINALGTVWDLTLDQPYRDKGIPNNHWNLDDLKSAIHIEGTLNDPRDIDQYWNVEMAIPMKALLELKRGPRKLPIEGEQWRANFSRVQWDHDIADDSYSRKKDKDGNFLREYNWVWSNQGVINMHEPEKWGTIQFTYETSSNNVAFINDELRIFEQVIFAAFRQTKKGKLKYLLNNEIGDKRIIKLEYSNGNFVDVSFNKTNMGFEYKLEIPNSTTMLLINESGELKKTK